MGSKEKTFIVKATHSSYMQIEVQLILGSAAAFSFVPKKDLKIIGVKPYRDVDFYLEDGTKITRHVGDAYFEYQGAGGAAPVVFAEEGDPQVVGASTLLSCLLVLNPHKKELFPVKNPQL